MDEAGYTTSAQTPKPIGALSKDSVHKICSGQVVLNLATAVKELVENSLDAGATAVEVRLKECGSQLIEVSDNGCGVEERDFEGLALKHYTSKLQEFSDLTCVETYGFRGEALSSLCALGEMSVLTCHKTALCGSRLEFDHRGHITSSRQHPRQIGTTVTLANIFCTLPVRQKEFHRNLQKEFNKMVQQLYAYCLVSTGVKITCTNQTKKGRTTIVATHGARTVRENIASVFGTKQLQSLVSLPGEPPTESALLEQGLSTQLAGKRGFFQVEGLVTTCAHGQGRGAPDRQFFYVNSRPCEPTKVMRCVNDVFHQFNRHQHPFVFLNIMTGRQNVDVNVTPDKRQVFLDCEKLLLAIIKSSLLQLYESVPSCIPVFTSSPSSTPAQSPTSGANFSALLSRWSRSPSQAGSSPDQSPRCRGVKRKEPDQASNGLKQLRLSRFIATSAPTDLKPDSTLQNVERTAAENHSCDLASADVNHQENYTEITESNISLQAYTDDEVFLVSGEPTPGEVAATSDHSCSLVDSVNSGDSVCVAANVVGTGVPDICNSTCKDNSFVKVSCEVTENHFDRCEGELQGNNFVADNNAVDSNTSAVTRILMGSCGDSDTTERLLEDGLTVAAELDKSEEMNCELRTTDYVACVQNVNPEDDVNRTFNVTSGAGMLTDEDFDSPPPIRTEVLVSVTISDVMEKFETLSRLKSRSGGDVGDHSVKFYAGMNPSKNSAAEEELTREVTKDHFRQMAVVGQFNLGFIVTRLGPDLLIIDQHASDEKYNFEMLQKNQALKSQVLVVPQTLELTAVSETILIDNMEIFQKNGFDFVINDTAEPTRRVRLSAIPMCKNWCFGKEDINELLFMLQDSPHTMCRPSRVRMMFASQACRKSVMIGTALSRSEMRRLVDHMAEMDRPWNCPHGRPTMRHLVNLEMCDKLASKAVKGLEKCMIAV